MNSSSCYIILICEQWFVSVIASNLRSCSTSGAFLLYLQIPLFRMCIIDGLGGTPTYLDPTLDHPLYMEAVEQALALCEEDAGPPHLKLVLEWDLQAKDR